MSRPAITTSSASRRPVPAGVITVTTREGQETSTGDWEVTYRAVLVKEEPPADLVRAAKGFGLFAGSLAAAPLLGPFIFGG